MKRRRLVVISLDSMGFRDLNELRELTPNLANIRQFMESSTIPSCSRPGSRQIGTGISEKKSRLQRFMTLPILRD